MCVCQLLQEMTTLNRIDQLKTNVWIDGNLVTGNISEHSAFKGIMKSQAALYDLQHDESLKDVMTYQSPSTGDRVGMSYLQPKTKEDLAKKTGNDSTLG